MLKFQNKISLITGSGTGIGQAIAKKFVENDLKISVKELKIKNDSWFKNYNKN